MPAGCHRAFKWDVKCRCGPPMQPRGVTPLVLPANHHLAEGLVGLEQPVGLGQLAHAKVRSSTGRSGAAWSTRWSKSGSIRCGELADERTALLQAACPHHRADHLQSLPEDRVQVRTGHAPGQKTEQHQPRRAAPAPGGCPPAPARRAHPAPRSPAPQPGRGTAPGRCRFRRRGRRPRRAPVCPGPRSPHTGGAEMLTICAAAVPTPLPTACTSTRSPVRRPRVTRASYAVRKASGTAAAAS